ncbi:hypothetical protein TL16_g04999 [Triparma laevis f. inornata]|uniref:Uncharacterized protein n=2 Tax=Triparma laevis TaxID=1534972 RepID=A0A9W7APH8_9STRA|nr:hypothetical protein TL16_g04999 [Triparma laevis f. inornata]GMH73635.1 hypothetical protein TrLO_g5733 [Triparma laevis f. longispina]
MPHWPPKTVATRLIRYVTQVHIAYNPYLANAVNPKHARGAKEFYVRLQSKRVTDSNPKLKLSCDVHNRLSSGEGAKVDITFVDGTSMNLSNFEGKVNDLEDELYQRASEIEYAMEVEGKSLD